MPAVSYIVAMRNPENGKLYFLMDEGHPAEYPTEGAAYDAASGHRWAAAWSAEIVPLGGTVPAAITVNS